MLKHSARFWDLYWKVPIVGAHLQFLLLCSQLGRFMDFTKTLKMSHWPQTHCSWCETQYGNYEPTILTRRLLCGGEASCTLLLLCGAPVLRCGFLTMGFYSNAHAGGGLDLVMATQPREPALPFQPRLSSTSSNGAKQRRLPKQRGGGLILNPLG